MKKAFVAAGIIVILAVSACTVTLAALRTEPKIMPYYGEEWHFDIGKKEYPLIIVIPKDRKDPQAYGNGYVRRALPKQKKYDIILLGE